MRRFTEFYSESRVQNIVGFSGGKDSTATYLLALEHSEKTGKTFRATFADTGNEHEETIEFVKTIHEKTGGPKVEIITSDFREAVIKKRDVVATKWLKDGVDPARIAEVIENLQPTGNPFLDLCISNGRWPSAVGKFCTAQLKVYPTIDQIILPAMKSGPIVQWSGVRGEESNNRSKMSPVDFSDPGYYIYRPIFNWSVRDVFALHKKHGLEPNPLYKQGFSRVGCMPCIFAKKSEIFNINARFPEHIERIAAWEKIISGVTKLPSGKSYMFTVNGEIGDVESAVAWSKTTRGGKQYSLDNFTEQEEPSACLSEYGLCE